MKKESSFMRNIKGGWCDEYRNVAEQYICPNPNGAPSAIPKGGKRSRRSQKSKKGKRRFLDNLLGGQSGGNCDNGDLIEKTSVNRACAPNDVPNDSQTAWARRYQSGDQSGGSAKGQSGGDGYALDPGNPVAGEPGFIRYTDTCRPIFPGRLTGGRRGRRGRKQGLITNLAYFGGKQKSKNKSPKSALKEANKSCKNCSFAVKMGGNMLSGAVSEVTRMLSPLGINALAGVVTLLFMDEMLRKRKITSKKQLGGSVGDYVGLFAPLGKNNLLALASLLLLNHYVVKKNSRKHKTHKGGNLIMADVGKLLAPLGVNTLGASLVLLLLSRCVSKKTIKKQQKGGGSLQPLIGLIAPLGINAFVATGVLAVLGRMFSHKSAVLHKKHRNSSLTEMRKELKAKLKNFKRK
jgi:hypothetical protein